MMKNSPAAATALGALFLLSAAAFAATEGEPIAEVVDVVKEAFHTPPGGDEAVAATGDRLLPDESIRTASDSAIEISFPDGASLRLEADSDLVLDTYVFDPSALKSAAAISISSGVARYTTGGISTDDSGVEFSTPVATVGIRGTDIVISVGPDGSTVIDVLAGKVSAKPAKNSEVAEAEEGQSVLIEKIDQPPQVGTIGDFATAAGEIPAGKPADDDFRDPQERAEKKEAPAAESGASDGGGTDNGGGGSGGDSGGGGSSDSDGDGNAGHGNNDGKHDNDNPGGGKGKNGKGG